MCALLYCTYYSLGDSSISNLLQGAAQDILGNPKSPLNQEILQQILSWALEVQGTASADLDSLHNFMVDTTTPG